MIRFIICLDKLMPKYIAGCKQHLIKSLCIYKFCDIIHIPYFSSLLFIHDFELIWFLYFFLSIDMLFFPAYILWNTFMSICYNSLSFSLSPCSYMLAQIKKSLSASPQWTQTTTFKLLYRWCIDQSSMGNSILKLKS